MCELVKVSCILSLSVIILVKVESLHLSGVWRHQTQDLCFNLALWVFHHFLCCLGAGVNINTIFFFCTRVSNCSMTPMWTAILVEADRNANYSCHGQFSYYGIMWLLDLLQVSFIIHVYIKGEIVDNLLLIVRPSLLIIRYVSTTVTQTGHDNRGAQHFGSDK